MTTDVDDVIDASGDAEVSVGVAMSAVPREEVTCGVTPLVGVNSGSIQGQIRFRSGSDQGQVRVNQGQIRVKSGSDQGQIRVKSGSDQGHAYYLADITWRVLAVFCQGFQKRQITVTIDAHGR